MSKLNLIGNAVQPASLLDIDGSAYVFFSSGIDGSMNKVLKFKMWLDASTINYTGQVGIPLIFRSNNAYGENDKFAFYAQPTAPPRLSVCVGGVYSDANGITFNITESMCNTVLNCEFRKAEKTIKWFKINDVSMISIAPSSLSGEAAQSKIGYNSINMSIWDVEIYDYDSSLFTGPGTLIHSCKGYPNGNTNIGWKNTIGVADGSIITYNAGTPTTRTISGVNYISTGTNKLKLVPNAITLKTGNKLLLFGYKPAIVMEYPILVFTTDASTLAFYPVFTVI